MRRTPIYDVGALSLSGLCLAHCLALPALAAFVPSIAAWAGVEWIHAVFVVLAVPTTALALWHAHQGQTLTRATVLLAITGLSALTVAITPAVGAYEVHATVLGSLLLACVHLWNWTRHHRSH